MFDWLSAHPDVCPSQLKETRFFLDPDYPLPRPRTFNGADLSGYRDFFACADERVWLDATPDAMFSDCLPKASGAIPDARVVVMVRDPVDRLLSAYLFFQQRGLLSLDLGFDEWISIQQRTMPERTTEVQWRALDHCRTARYLPRLRDAWGDRLLELRFKDLVRDPLEQVARICDHAGIRPLGADEFEVRPSNRTVQARWPKASLAFHAVRRSVATRTLRYPWVRASLRPLSRGAKRLLNKRDRMPRPEPDQATIDLIHSETGS